MKGAIGFLKKTKNSGISLLKDSETKGLATTEEVTEIIKHSVYLAKEMVGVLMSW